MGANVITVTWQVGSWGGRIGVEVAGRLNMRYVDREIISKAAERAGISEESLERLEGQRGLIQRLIHSLLSMPAIPSKALRQSEFYSLVGKDDRFQSLVREGFSQTEATKHVVAMKLFELRGRFDYLNLIKSVAMEFAQSGNVVLAGSGNQIFLKDQKGVMHVLIMAPLEARISAIMEQQGVSRKAAEKHVEESDETRWAFIRHHYKLDWLDPSLYGLVVNTGCLSRELAVGLITKAAQDFQ